MPLVVPGRTGVPRRPRLLMVGPLPPPIGGVETFTQAMLESRAFDAFELRHCDTTKGRAKDTQGRFDPANFAWAARHFARMVHAMASFRPDVVVIPVAGTWSGFLRDAGLGWIARRWPCRVIGHQHAGDISRQLERRGLARRLVRGGFAQFHRVLVLGERWRTLFRDHGLAMPIEVCPSTFRREVVERAAGFARPSRGGARPRLLFVGQVGRRKGVLDLIEALKRLRARGLALTLTVVGPAQAAGELDAARSATAAAGLDDAVRFTGPLTGEPLYDEFRGHDLFVLPSYNEGIPAVLYEAGSFGMALVTTPVGGIPDLVRHESNGLLVEPGDVDAVAASIERLARDPALAERLAARLRDDVLAFHPDRVSERMARAVADECAIAGIAPRSAPAAAPESP